MPQLDPTWFASQLFWLAVSLAVLYVALARFILPPLTRALELRAGTRHSDLTNAQRLKDEAEEARRAYEQALTDARSRAQSLFAEAELKQRQAQESALTELSRQFAVETKKAEQALSAKKDALMAQLEPAAVEMTAAVVEKLLGRKPDSARAAKLVQEQFKKA